MCLKSTYSYNKRVKKHDKVPYRKHLSLTAAHSTLHHNHKTIKQGISFGIMFNQSEFQRLRECVPMVTEAVVVAPTLSDI